ncbi:MAG: twitching motility protein PilT [Lachnospiraceae bacterium]|nr:twitching motility protein PilT [Lachnospiraceae bacterium]
MLQIIIGEEGKGKTRLLLNMANDEIKVSGGSVLFIDQSNKHIYELSNQIRFVNVRDFDIDSTDMFIGFILGIISSDHDLEKIFLDNFKILSKSHSDKIDTILDKLQAISEKNNLDFVISLSMPANELNEKFKDNIIKTV